jgi:hypothetical protein
MLFLAWREFLQDKEDPSKLVILFLENGIDVHLLILYWFYNQDYKNSYKSAFNNL